MKARKHYPRIHEHLWAQVCGSHHFCFSNYISDFIKSLYENCDYFWYHGRKFYQVSSITGHLYTHIIKLKLGQIFNVFESLIENNSQFGHVMRRNEESKRRNLWFPFSCCILVWIGLQGPRNFQTFHLKMKNYKEWVLYTGHTPMKKVCSLFSVTLVVFNCLLCHHLLPTGPPLCCSYLQIKQIKGGMQVDQD